MTKTNLFVTKPEENPSVAAASFYCATVTEVTSEGIRILIDGEPEPTTKAFKQLNPEHAFSVGDRVVAMLQSGTYVILGTLGYPGAAGVPLPIIHGGTGQSGVIVETEAQNIVTPAEGWSISGAFFAQWGKLAMILIEIDATQAMSVSASVPVANVVAGKRPRTFAPAQAWLSTSRAALITTDGDLRLSSGSISAGSGYSIMSVYMLA